MILRKFYFPDFHALRLIAPHEKPHIHHRVSINLFSSLCPDTLVVYHSHAASVLSVTPWLGRWEIDESVQMQLDQQA